MATGQRRHQSQGPQTAPAAAPTTLPSTGPAWSPLHRVLTPAHLMRDPGSPCLLLHLPEVTSGVTPSPPQTLKPQFPFVATHSGPCHLLTLRIKSKLVSRTLRLLDMWLEREGGARVPTTHLPLCPPRSPAHHLLGRCPRPLHWPSCSGPHPFLLPPRLYPCKYFLLLLHHPFLP